MMKAYRKGMTDDTATEEAEQIAHDLLAVSLTYHAGGFLGGYPLMHPFDRIPTSLFSFALTPAWSWGVEFPKISSSGRKKPFASVSLR